MVDNTFCNIHCNAQCLPTNPVQHYFTIVCPFSLPYLEKKDYICRLKFTFNLEMVKPVLNDNMVTKTGAILKWLHLSQPRAKSN